MFLFISRLRLRHNQILSRFNILNRVLNIQHSSFLIHILLKFLYELLLLTNVSEFIIKLRIPEISILTCLTYAIRMSIYVYGIGKIKYSQFVILMKYFQEVSDYSGREPLRGHRTATVLTR